jgi:hypothetical protein
LGRCRSGLLSKHRRAILRAIWHVAYTYGNSYSNCDCDCDVGSYRDVHGNADSNRHFDIYANADRYSTAQPDAAAYPGTETPSHSTPTANAVTIRQLGE